MPSQPSSSPAVALRSAIASPFRPLQLAAIKIITTAQRETPSLAAAAAALGIDRKTLYRLRADCPELRE